MFRTRSQLPVGSSAARPIVVNEYCLYAESSSDHDLLLRGHLVTGHESLWINPNRSPTRATIHSTSFELASKPPKNDTRQSHPTPTEWNADIGSSGEIFNLDELEEFKNTDLNFLMHGNTVKRSQSSGSLQERPSKRRKLDIASLRNVISQPHVFPSLASVSIKKSVAPYSKSKPIPIPPHSLPLPDPLPYTRRSWVIPVRGSLPWRHATSAVVLLDSNDSPEPPDPNTHEEIAWTADALSSFWSFLLLLRGKSTVGPLGLSFHVAPDLGSSQPTYTELSGMGAQPLTLQTPDIKEAPSTVSSFRLAVFPVTFVDHIKVYHDAACSMQLRNLLDAWAFQFGEGKIRILKGSRLVLLDERAKGILVL